jgi:hypothetical protein
LPVFTSFITVGRRSVRRVGRRCALAFVGRGRSRVTVHHLQVVKEPSCHRFELKTHHGSRPHIDRCCAIGLSSSRRCRHGSSWPGRCGQCHRTGRRTDSLVTGRSGVPPRCHSAASRPPTRGPTGSPSGQRPSLTAHLFSLKLSLRRYEVKGRRKKLR